MVDVRTLGSATISAEGERRLGLLAHPDAFVLLVRLALEGPLRRAELLRVLAPADAALHPPDQTASAALLSELVEAIRASLGPGAVEASEDELRLGATAGVRLDAARFADRIANGDWAGAVREYGGVFMAGLPPPEAPGLARWRDTTRDRLAEQARAARARVEESGPAAGRHPTERHPAEPLPDPPRSPLSRFMDRARERVIYQLAAVYIMVAWAGLQVIDMLVDREVLADAWFKAALTVAGMGFLIVMLFAWAQQDNAVGLGGSPETRGPWPRWVRRPRTTQVVVALASALVVLVAAIVVLRGVLPEPPAAAAPADPRSIAVLYFDDFSANQDLGPVASGFTNDLIGRLHAVPTLDVRSLSAVKPYRGGDVPLDSVFKALDVGAVVAGGLTGAGDSLRATVNLIEPADGGTRLLASADLVGATGSELALGADLVAEVARLLREELGVAIRLRDLRTQTGNDDAWVLVQRALEAREEAESILRTDGPEAIRLLSESDSLLAGAERQDPDWVAPIVERGWTADRRSLAETEFAGNYEASWAREAMRHADRALAMAPGDAAAAELRGRVGFGLAIVSTAPEAGDLMREAERDLLAALQADADRPVAAWALSNLYRTQNRYGEASRYARRALEADYYFDEAPRIVFQLYTTANDLRDAEAANEHCSEGRRRWSHIGAFYQCGLTLLKSYGAASSDVRQAREWVDSLVRVSPELRKDYNRRWGLMVTAGIAAKAQLADSARALIELARAPEPDPLLAYDEAHAWVLLGEPERALDSLEEYAKHRPATRESLRADWWFEALYELPRFKALTGQLGDV
ncbi:MAG: hypothetical protein ABFS46_01305 [Myxococcota bacterium]